MNSLQILAALGDLASIVFAVIATIGTILIWKLYTNHLPHIYSELRSLREFMKSHDNWEREEKYPPK